MIDNLVNIGKLVVLVTIGVAVSLYVLLLIKGVQLAVIGIWS